MRKIKILVLAASLTLLLVGCGAIRVNVKKEVNKTVEELFGYLSKDDTESIKNMFCTIVSESDDFDEELSKAVEFFEGEVTSYDITAIGSDEKTERGKTMQLHVSPYIWDIETSAGKSYKIRYYAYIVNSDNAQYVGISEIDIECADGDTFKLGDFYLANPDEKRAAIGMGVLEEETSEES